MREIIGGILLIVNGVTLFFCAMLLQKWLRERKQFYFHELMLSMFAFILGALSFAMGLGLTGINL